ncbi:MAG: adenylate/guanylate cyclase domain-containing protein [Desulfovibrionaceae bacterium]
MSPSHQLDRPVPLRRVFVRWVLPGIAVFLGLVVAVVVLASDRAARGVSNNAVRAVAGHISFQARRVDPAGWTRVLDGSPLPAGEEVLALRLALKPLAQDFGLAGLWVYHERGGLVFSLDGEAPGNPVSLDAVRRALAGEAGAELESVNLESSSLVDFFTPLPRAVRGERAVMVLRRPASRHELLTTGLRVFAPALAAALLLAGLLVLLTRLVFRAQRRIDAHTAELVRLRRRLESFLSRSAVDAAHRAAPGEDVASRRACITVLEADVRGFTTRFRNRAPEVAVGFLNRLTEVELGAVEAEDGDVDKFIGDAVLAWFEGEAAEARAVRAARAMLAGVDPDGPGLGVGLYTGEAIVGAVGPARRRDFTIIGHAVNMASRLCGLAAPGDLVADEATVRALPEEEGAAFGPAEREEVKGGGPMTVRRLRVAAGTESPGTESPGMESPGMESSGMESSGAAPEDRGPD